VIIRLLLLENLATGSMTDQENFID